MKKSDLVDAISSDLEQLAVQYRDKIVQQADTYVKKSAEQAAEKATQAVVAQAQQAQQQQPKQPIGTLPWWRGVRGLIRSFLYGQHKDNPDYRDYGYTKEHRLTLEQYKSKQQQINYCCDQISNRIFENLLEENGIIHDFIGDLSNDPFYNAISVLLGKLKSAALQIIKNHLGSLGTKKVDVTQTAPANSTTATPSAVEEPKPLPPTPEPVAAPVSEPSRPINAPTGSVPLHSTEKPAAHTSSNKTVTPDVDVTRPVRTVDLAVNQTPPKFIDETEKNRLTKILPDLEKTANGQWLGDRKKSIQSNKKLDAIEVLKKNNVPIESTDPNNISDKDVEVVSYVFGFPPNAGGEKGAKNFLKFYISQESKKVPKAPTPKKKPVQNFDPNDLGIDEDLGDEDDEDVPEEVRRHYKAITRHMADVLRHKEAEAQRS